MQGSCGAVHCRANPHHCVPWGVNNGQSRVRGLQGCCCRSQHPTVDRTSKASADVANACSLFIPHTKHSVTHQNDKSTLKTTQITVIAPRPTFYTGMHNFPEATPVVILPLEGHTTGEYATDGSRAAGSPGGVGSPAVPQRSQPLPFEHIQCSVLPPGAVETTGGCSCRWARASHEGSAAAQSHQHGQILRAVQHATPLQPTSCSGDAVPPLLNLRASQAGVRRRLPMRHRPS
jgi:hypothetical protein